MQRRRSQCVVRWPDGLCAVQPMQRPQAACCGSRHPRARRPWCAGEQTPRLDRAHDGACTLLRPYDRDAALYKA